MVASAQYARDHAGAVVPARLPCRVGSVFSVAKSAMSRESFLLPRVKCRLRTGLFCALSSATPARIGRCLFIHCTFSPLSYLRILGFF